MSSMRKLNEFMRSLYRFLADPAAHVTKSWATIKAAIPPPALEREDMRNAVVVFDNIAEAVSHFLQAKGAEDDKQEKLAT